MVDRIAEGSPFEGMTRAKATGMIGSLLRPMHGNQRFALKHKNAIAEFVEETALNENESTNTRLQCVGHIISMEKLNFEQEKLNVMVQLQQEKASEDKDSVVEGPKVIMILPKNGSEAQK